MTPETRVDPATGQTVKGFDELITSYEPTQKDLQVRGISLQGANKSATASKIQTVLLSGQVDVILAASVFTYFDQGLLADLTPYFEKDNWKANYLPTLYRPPMERLMYPSWSPEPTKYISAPADLATASLAYDAQLFEDFGVAPLGAVPTIEEVLEAAAKLTGPNPRTGEKCYGLWYDPSASAHAVLFYLNHGVDFGTADPSDPTKIKFNDSSLGTAIEKMVEIAKLCPPGFELGQGAENWGSERNNIGINLVVQMTQMLPAVNNKLTDRFVVTEGVRDADNHNFFVSASEYAIGAKCTNKDAAWDLVKFLSGPTAQRFRTENYNALPTWQAEDWTSDTSPAYSQPFLATAAAATNAYFPSFMFTTFRPWMTKTISEAVHGNTVDITAGLDDMQQQAEKWVEEGAK